MAKKKKKHTSKTGLPPGSLVFVGEQKTEKVLFEVHSYSPAKCTITSPSAVNEIKTDDPAEFHWINVTGLHDEKIIQEIGQRFNIPLLQLEDVMNVGQRPKVEITPDGVFLILKMIEYNDKSQELDFEQVSVFCNHNCVITFQEKPGDDFDPLRARLQNPQSRLRMQGPDFLFYALFDVIVDHYLMALEHVDDDIDALDEHISLNHDKEHMQAIHNLKKETVSFRKAVWPMRNFVSGMIAENQEVIRKETLPYLRDVEDHIKQVMDGLDQHRDMLQSLMDSYLSVVSFRMNEIMKVLTIIATIFIPLTFLAGIYGMNFEYFPEIHWRFGYFIFWAISAIIVIVLLLFFKRKRWL